MGAVRGLWRAGPGAGRTGGRTQKVCGTTKWVPQQGIPGSPEPEPGSVQESQVSESPATEAGECGRCTGQPSWEPFMVSDCIPFCHQQ
jgi:hypothetical protein